jgi:threonine synthase
MVVVQSDGCAPIVRAFDAGQRLAEPWDNARSAAPGIRVPSAVGDFMILDAVQASGGCAVAVPDGRIATWQRMATTLTGLSICPEGAACVGALIALRDGDLIAPGERVVIFNTASAHKYDHADPCDVPVIDPARPVRPQLRL